MEEYKKYPTKKIQELEEIQLTSNTKDARAGRNTNTSILVAADMHATEALNQQWETTSSGNRFQIRSNCRYYIRGHTECPHQGPLGGLMNRPSIEPLSHID